MTKDVPSYPKTDFKASNPNEKLRVYREDVLKALGKKRQGPRRREGPQGVQRGNPRPAGVPDGARSERRAHPRRQEHTVGTDGERRGRDLQDQGGDSGALLRQKGVTSDKEVITYCRIGERSSHSWFVLTYLLGYPHVRNYDGSWTEWGNSSRDPHREVRGQGHRRPRIGSRISGGQSRDRPCHSGRLLDDEVHELRLPSATRPVPGGSARSTPSAPPRPSRRPRRGVRPCRSGTGPMRSSSFTRMPAHSEPISNIS